MKTAKATGSVLLLVLLTIAMGLYLAGGVVCLMAADAVKSRYRRLVSRLRGEKTSPARRFQTAAVKVYPAVPGLVMDEDGFVEPPAARSETPARGLQLVVNNRPKAASLANLHGMSAAELVASHGGAGEGLLAFPEASERESRKATRLAREAAAAPALPANVLRICDFKSKKKKD